MVLTRDETLASSPSWSDLSVAAPTAFRALAPSSASHPRDHLHAAAAARSAVANSAPGRALTYLPEARLTGPEADLRLGPASGSRGIVSRRVRAALSSLAARVAAALQVFKVQGDEGVCTAAVAACLILLR